MVANFGEFIRTKRVDRRINLRSFAKLTNKSPLFISELESGYIKPTKDVLIGITNVLKLTKSEIEEFERLTKNGNIVERMPVEMLDSFESKNQIIVALRRVKGLEATEEEWEDIIKRLQQSRTRGDD